MNQLEIKVKAAEIRDIPEMVAINAAHLMANKSEKSRLNQSGFLIVKLTADDVERMILDEENFVVLVLKKKEEVLGYLIACTIANTENFFQEALAKIPELQNSQTKPFYYKQIAKKIGEAGVGKSLLLALENEARKRGYSHLVCRIVHQPILNEASISFHQKSGFKLVSTFSEEQITAGIYLKAL